jgi:hypothetical protein
MRCEFMTQESVLDRWLPQMISHFSAGGLAAVDEFKKFIRDHVSIAALEDEERR